MQQQNRRKTKMAGYQDDFSKSNNAVAAENAGRFPATRAARILGVPTGFIKDRCAFACGGEYHHTSKFCNCTDYYDTHPLFAWKNGEPDALEEHDGQTLADAVSEWSRAKKAEKAAPAKVHTGCTVTWLVWGGSRRHPQAREEIAQNCAVTDRGGEFLTITLPCGTDFRKGRNTNGLIVKNAEGRVIYGEQ
jgi:hypothetical protein